MKKIFIPLIFLAALPACTRTAEKTALIDAPVQLGPTNRDTKVPLVPSPTEAMLAALRTEQEMNTASYLRLAEDIQALSRFQNSETLFQLSRDLVNSYRGEETPSRPFSRSIYADTMIGEGEPQVKPELDAVSRDLRSAIDAVFGLLEKSKTAFPWPERIINYNDAIQTADEYVRWLSDKIPSLNLSPKISRPLQGAIHGEYRRLRPELQNFANKISGSRSFAEAVSTVKSALEKFKVKLDPEIAAQFVKADSLVASLETTRTSQDALSLIIEVWQSIPPGDREAVFKEAAPEFYDFLKGKDEASLKCLASGWCLNPVLEVARRLVILPKISEYGVDKIRNQIDSAARDQLLATVLEAASELLPTVPDLVKTQAMGEAQKYQDLINRVLKNFAGFAKDAFRDWEKENFRAELRGLDPSRVKIRIRGRDKIRVALPKPGRSGSVTTGAEVLGLSLSLAQEHLPESSDQKAALLEPINKLLAITGFRQFGGKLFPSFLLPIDGKRSDVFDIRQLLQGRTTYAVPDSFRANEDFIMDRAKALANASVGSQSELLRGISRQIRFHRDWERNQFDEVLGDTQIEDIIDQIPKGSVNYSAFPKDMIFTLAVGGAGAILQNVVRDLSPAFLILPNGKFIWGDKYKEIGEGEGNVSTVAGLVDVVNGKRGQFVRTADVARYILALDEFLSAMEGIEQTKSALLTNVGKNGKSVLDELRDARRYLRLFQMALTNYLTFVAQNKDGGFHSVYDIEKKSVVPGDRLLADQALAIRALMASSRQLNLKLFSWAALDGYFFMNKTMWDESQQFYAPTVKPSGQKMGAASILDVAATLRAGEELSPFMSTSIRAQWEQIAGLWVRALQDF
jgi:hypothetical protein